MYQLNQTLPVSADFPDREVVTVASWDHQPTRDELIALDLTPATADTILRVGHNGGKVPFLRLEHFPEKFPKNNLTPHACGVLLSVGGEFPPIKKNHS